ncbi:polymeric immunoglobulin receptor-like [Alosa sapidissima]|uniref:polymeric immunoglobulin receptor-like n=1 Tax=Alosa sapidissima TaxID=34773 RepID=UPI001C08B8FC|nr:polymeric immunoglobulin receptor-like [Alosa sapidissima]
MGSAILKAFVGAAVIFECSYRPEYRDRRKYFCKTDDTSCLSSGISQPPDKRISLFDNNNGLFRSLFTALTENDSGNYMCIVETAPNVYINTTKTLRVDPDPLYMQSIVKSGYVGGDVIIDCPYPPTSNGSVKYFYRQKGMSAYPEIVSSQSSQPNSRYSLVAKDNETQVSLVTIRKLTPADAGSYWCGFRTGGFLGGITMTTEVKLRVFGGRLRSTTDYGRPTSPVSKTPPVSTSSPLSNVLSVILVLILVVAAILFGGMMYRRRVKRRRAQVSASQAAPQGNAVSPSAATGVMAMAPCDKSEDRNNPQPEHVYLIPLPDTTPPGGGDHEAGAPTSSSSENIYEPLKFSPSQADGGIYLTLDPKPKE